MNKARKYRLTAESIGLRAPDHRCMVAAAVIGSAVVGGVVSASASKSAANTQANAAQNASDAQLQATRESNALQLQMYQQNLTNQQPQLQAGQSALAALQNGLGLGRLRASGTSASAAGGMMTNAQGQQVDAAGNVITGGTAGSGANYGASQGELDSAGNAVASGQLQAGFKPSDLTLDPSYQFRLDQGMKSLQASAAARGGLLTGQGLKDITNYGQGAASQEYQAAYDRNRTTQNDLYNRLANLAGVGQVATGAIGAAGSNAANSIGANTMAGVGASNNYLTSGAAAQAAGTVGSANALQGGINSGVGNWMTLQYLNGRNASSAPLQSNSSPAYDGTYNSGGWT